MRIGGSGFGNPFWVRGYKNTLPRRAPPPKMHGKTRAGEVCFSLERKTHFVTPFHLYHGTFVYHLRKMKLGHTFSSIMEQRSYEIVCRNFSTEKRFMEKHTESN